jgi:hypothetical protein
MNDNYAQPAVQICADVHFSMLIRTGVRTLAIHVGKHLILSPEGLSIDLVTCLAVHCVFSSFSCWKQLFCGLHVSSVEQYGAEKTQIDRRIF